MHHCVGIHEWCIFQALFNLVAQCLPNGPKLSKFSVFLTFFLKIRLNLANEDIIAFQRRSATVDFSC